MKKILGIFVVLVISLIACEPASEADNTPKGIVKDGATVQKLAAGFSFTEGPIADNNGDVYFTDQPNDKIYKWLVDDQILTVFLEESERSNGLYWSKDNVLLACADYRNKLVSFDAEGNMTVLLDNINGKTMNAPNDLWEDPKGGIYFSDPWYQRGWWDHDKTQMPGEFVYYLPKGAKQPIIVEDGFVRPNGLIGTPDGKKLYATDINSGKTYSYDILENGKLDNKALFCNEGSDGMTIDNLGNVYLTNRVVSVFKPDGTKLTEIIVPETPSNVCFGGKDKSTLFITARTGFYSIEMNVHGM